MTEMQKVTADPMAQLVAALAKALPEIEGVAKNKPNPAFKSKYADLGACIAALHPITAHGLWYRQVAHKDPDGACVETFYVHEAGAELSAGEMFVPADRKNAHGFGSAQSYARRYGLQTAFGLATEDDDGNAAAKASKDAHHVSDEPAPKPRGQAHSALKQKVRGFVHNLNGCGDGDELSAYLATPEAIAVVNEVQANLPDWWTGWPEQPDGFTPLCDLITKRQQECAAVSASYATV